MKKILTTLIILIFVTNVFSVIGYEHFTVQENEVFIELLVRLSGEMTSEGNVKNIDPVRFGEIIESTITGFDIDIVVTDASGTIIYDADSAEIGKNTLTDPLYQSFPELRELFQQHITVEKRGESSYSFYATGMGATQRKYVMWNTIEAFGTQIKVCMITK